MNRKERKKAERKKGNNRHHVVPKSRKNKKSKGFGQITTYVDVDLHDWYHAIFGNMLPEEVFSFLNRELWASQYQMKRRIGK